MNLGPPDEIWGDQLYDQDEFENDYDDENDEDLYDGMSWETMSVSHKYTSLGTFKACDSFYSAHVVVHTAEEDEFDLEDSEDYSGVRNSLLSPST